MASGKIKLEIDPESLREVKAELKALYELADEASRRMEYASVKMKMQGRFWNERIYALFFLLGVFIGLLAAAIGG